MTERQKKIATAYTYLNKCFDLLMETKMSKKKSNDLYFDYFRPFQYQIRQIAETEDNRLIYDNEINAFIITKK